MSGLHTEKKITLSRPNSELHWPVGGHVPSVECKAVYKKQGFTLHPFFTLCKGVKKQSLERHLYQMNLSCTFILPFWDTQTAGYLLTIAPSAITHTPVEPRVQQSWERRGPKEVFCISCHYISCPQGSWQSITVQRLLPVKHQPSPLTSLQYFERETIRWKLTQIQTKDRNVITEYDIPLLGFVGLHIVRRKIWLCRRVKWDSQLQKNKDFPWSFSNCRCYLLLTAF